MYSSSHLQLAPRAETSDLREHDLFPACPRCKHIEAMIHTA
jgi:hypothetical protein